ncbi:hypothetical protein KAU19_07975 [Candidatus Parcubacteria bacterium]|nr:hypothetical protein [Candidatus Parcubacteria bacterium]
MSKKIKIYFPLDSAWGIVLQRITYDIQRNAPENFEFVHSYEECDILFTHIIGQREIKKDKPYVVFFHCFGLDRGSQVMDKFTEMFKNALMVYTYYPINEFLPSMEGINLMRRPWGVDSSIFYRMPEVPKTYTCLATGYVARTEAILELYRACEAVNGKLLHIGGSIEKEVGMLNPIYYERHLGITDNDMRKAYNACQWVSGLRRHEGFEIPALEGFLCGAQPICFDIPIFYNHWFSDFATFIPHSSQEIVTEELIKLFKTKPLISSQKMETVKEKFDVNKLSSEFWSEFNKLI